MHCAHAGYATHPRLPLHPSTLQERPSTAASSAARARPSKARRRRRGRAARPHIRATALNPTLIRPASFTPGAQRAAQPLPRPPRRSDRRGVKHNATHAAAHATGRAQGDGIVRAFGYTRRQCARRGRALARRHGRLKRRAGRVHALAALLYGRAFAPDALYLLFPEALGRLCHRDRESRRADRAHRRARQLRRPPRPTGRAACALGRGEGPHLRGCAGGGEMRGAARGRGVDAATGAIAAARRSHAIHVCARDLFMRQGRRPRRPWYGYCNAWTRPACR